MSNIDKQSLRIPERKKHNWGKAVMRDCDFCQQWALTVRHSDGGRICASCCDSEYTAALSCALVVALDELEAKDRRLEEEIGRTNREHHRGFMMACGHLKEHSNVHYADAAEMEIAALRKRINELENAAAGKGE